MRFRNPAGWLVVALALCLAAPEGRASLESELAFHRGVLAYGDENLDEAQRQFELVLEDDPEDTAALHYLALIAQRRGNPAEALALLDRAVAIDPEDADLQLERGVVLLDVGRVPEARQALERAVELDPGSGRAQLFAGIAAYRAGAYAEAKPYLERAGELDPSLRDESRYYAGLSNAFIGDLQGAVVAFDDAAQQSPMSPLAQSAQNFRQQLSQPTKPERRWNVDATFGLEYDSNPLILGDSTPAVFVPNADPDGRAVFRLHGDYRLLRRENANVTAGYDAYLGLNFDASNQNTQKVDLQTHNAWVSGGYDIGPVRLGLRYDYAFTFLDLTEPFRHFHRIAPSVAVRQGEWGASFFYYQFRYQDFLRDLLFPNTFDREGTGNIGGFNQFFFLPAPFTYVRLGVLGDWLRTEGTEWSYNGVETNFGAGYDFDYDISFSWLYRFVYRHYRNASAVASPAFSQKQDVYRHQLTLDLTKKITEHWAVSAGAALTWNDSDVKFYEYDRQIGGAYVTYSF